jgi:hypothetical protein
MFIIPGRRLEDRTKDSDAIVSQLLVSRRNRKLEVAGSIPPLQLFFYHVSDRSYESAQVTDR